MMRRRGFLAGVNKVRVYGMVATGLARVAAGDYRGLDGKRIGLLCNQTAVDGELRHAADLLHQDSRFELRALFGPEHGVRGDAQDMVAVGAAQDRRTDVPLYSLYGADASSLAPTAEMLSGLDAVVYDIQDVGARYYTFVWSMVLAMRACAEAGVEFVVLDRPNPIGGVAVEGGAVLEAYRSFVGLCSVPNRHGLTAGEIARMTMAREGLDLELQVVEMRGWSRAMYYDATGLPWVAPSPNMPTQDTALVYPGMCLVEGTELSEGRGTTRPFEYVGAPFVDGHELARDLAAESLPGVQWRPMTFTPMFQKHAAQPCGGVQLHVTDRERFCSYLSGVALVRAIYRRWSEAFAWRTRAYEFVDDIAAFDLLTGSASIREGIAAGQGLEELAHTWKADEVAFCEERRGWLLYR